MEQHGDAALSQLEQTRQEDGGQPSTSGSPSSFVILHSVSKRHNVGTIARCCTAFGVKQMCLVGSREFNTFGGHGSDAYVDFRHYGTLEQCVASLKATEGCEIIGIEIMDGALPIQTQPFTGPTAFMLGNEGQGLSPKQIALCDKFVYIPQHGVGTASLNVAVAASIVLHHYALWAGYQERQREGQKFVVAERPVKTRARGMAVDPEEVRAERQRRDMTPEQLEAEESAAANQLAALLD